MNGKDNASASHEPAVDRRRFLGITASLAGGAILPRAVVQAAQRVESGSTASATSAVVEVQSDKVVVGPTVHPALPGEMLGKALTALTGAQSESDAWHHILRAGDVVALKFNRSAQQVIGTSSAMAEAVVTSLVEAGWRSDRIVCIEAPEGVARRLGTTQPMAGYEHTTSDFGSGSDQFAAVLNQVTALISIPYLKTHRMAGLTCSMKNLSHGLVKHPARFHRDGCAPFIADIVAHPQIRDKLRLCLVDAFRVVYADGPEATAETISDEGVLLVSKDPVAIDTVGLGLVNDIRKRKQLAPIQLPGGKQNYLTLAARRGLGISTPYNIDLVRVAG
ncbi:MAG: DUF362 domain-containing protein [Planctomycetes bacterium]|nr:DUF362 domain-containing protein [Planctomycetota bacterium]